MSSNMRYFLVLLLLVSIGIWGLTSPAFSEGCADNPVDPDAETPTRPLRPTLIETSTNYIIVQVLPEDGEEPCAFMIQVRGPDHDTWDDADRMIPPDNRKIKIGGLEPSTNYAVRGYARFERSDWSPVGPAKGFVTKTVDMVPGE